MVVQAPRMASVSPPKPWERAGAGATGMCPGKAAIATLGTDDRRLETTVGGTDHIVSCRRDIVPICQSTYVFYTHDYDFHIYFPSTRPPSKTLHPLPTNICPQCRR